MKGREAIAAKWGAVEASVYDALFGGAETLPSSFKAPASHDQRQTIEYKALACVAYCLAREVLPPDWAAAVYRDGWMRFDALIFGHRELGQSFGLRPLKHMDALMRDQCAMGIGMTVWKMHKGQGIPLKSSRTKGPGAIELASRHWSKGGPTICETKVRQYWREYQRFVERCESMVKGAENSKISAPSGQD